jgi:16S rRNA (uracil1498-N3)-methyltransferase
MHRFFVEPMILQGDLVELPAVTAHQVRNVLRMGPGDRLLLLDNLGWQVEAELVEVTRRRVTVRLLERQPASGEPQLKLTLYQSLLKKDNFEWVLQKGTELGVSRFVPLLTERTVVGEQTLKPNKLARWRRILIEAAEQCCRARIPQLAPAQTFADALADPARLEYALIPALVAETHLLEVVNGRSPLPNTLALFIGPEGGFSPAEIEQAQTHGLIPVSLGPYTLRAETAALAAATLIVQYSQFVIRNS